MKINILIVCLFFIFTSAFAQKEKPCGVKNGLQEGTCKAFYPNGKTTYAENWKKGKREGISFYYFDTGKIKATGNFTKDKKNGPWKYYNEDGTLSAEENFVYREFTEIKEGAFAYYYKNGKIKETNIYVDDKLEGKQTEHFENGNISKILIFKNNLRNGECKFYYEDGSIQEESFYKEGLAEGPSTSYHKNGQINCVLNFAGGKIVGEKICKDINGKIIPKDIPKETPKNTKKKK